jgi:hypothetical protein
MVYHVQRLAASVSRLSTRYASVIATAKEALKGCGPGLPSFDWPQRLAKQRKQRSVNLSRESFHDLRALLAGVQKFKRSKV